MKVSLSSRSGSLLLAAVYLAAHLPFLAPSLEDIDSINFALGLRDFDVANHQPHPPGYPVYIALGRVMLNVVTFVSASLDAVTAEALALAIWSAVAGAVALVAAWALFAELDARTRRAGLAPQDPPYIAVLLLAFAPLFWMSGLRPLSDMPGLAAALVAQALIVKGLTARRFLVAGALAAGLAAGIRVQTLALTVPLLAFALVHSRAAGIWWLLSRPLASLAIGIFAWVVPLLAASGGLDGYLRALATQAGEDFAWVDMLWANPTPRRLAFSLYETFVLPWSSAALAAVVAAAAAAGVVAALRRDRRTLLLMALAFGPYVAFHVLLQETFTVRYALPVLPAVAWLSARGLAALGRAGGLAAALLAASAAVLSVPGSVAYGREPHPAFRAIADMEARASALGNDPAGDALPTSIHAHFSMRRPLQAHPPAGVRVVEPPRSHEWMGLVDYWRNGGRGDVWFLADSRRTDLDLVDRHSRRAIRYEWAVGDRLEFRGTRPLGVDWHIFQQPGWFAGEGWSLTPETGGVARASGVGPDRRPIEAYVRRREEPIHVMVGGGYIDSAAEVPVTVELSIDDLPIERWRLEPGTDGRFLRFLTLPDGLRPSPGDYARLTIAARAEAGRPTPAVAIRQFDAQPTRKVMYGFGEGWHDEEYDNATGRRWRWTSERSVVQISPARRVRLSMRGESPLRYFDGPPLVRITAAGREIARLRPEDDFEWDVRIGADVVAAANGAIAIETDRVYEPGRAEGTEDTRRLGLRLFEIDVYPVEP